MPLKADFYLLSSTAPSAVEQFVCRLIRKVQPTISSTLIWTASAAQSQILDELLWTFSDESFIPHRIIDEALVSTDFPVQICETLPKRSDDASDFDLVVSLNQSETNVLRSSFQAEQVGSNPDSEQRIAEIISGDESAKVLGRKRYALYRDFGFTVNAHPIA